MDEGIDMGSKEGDDVDEAKATESPPSNSPIKNAVCTAAETQPSSKNWFGRSSFGSEERIGEEIETSMNGNELQKDEAVDLGSDFGSVYEV